MFNLWTDQIVAFHPLFEKDTLLGFAITNGSHKIFYKGEANYNALLSEANAVIVFDGYAINRFLKDFVYCKHNLRTLYYQIKSQNRFQTVKDLVRQEYYTENSSDYTYLDHTERLEGAKQTILEASFIREFYLKYYKQSNKEILKTDNALLKMFTLKKNPIKVNQLAIRTDLSSYQLQQWEAERKIFHIVGHPVVSLSQLSKNQQQDKTLQELFSLKTSCKTKYESLLRYLDIDELDLDFDITASSTGRIFCRGESIGLFAPDNEFKQNFCTIPNYTFISADYSKQEASILAVVSKDKRLQKDLQNKHYYAKLAKLLTGIEDKQTGKDLFYALIYGISISALANKLGISENRAAYVKRELQDRYKNLVKWLKNANSLKTNFFGRKLYESTANAYTQSTAADIVRLKLLETIDFNPVCVFSDNIIYAVPDTNVNECKQKIKTILEDISPFKLSISIDCSKNLKFV